MRAAASEHIFWSRAEAESRTRRRLGRPCQHLLVLETAALGTRPLYNKVMFSVQVGEKR